jgi:holo-[acyl-carrier protein] synthase
MITTGVDIVEISRIERAVTRFGARFLSRVYTQDEVHYSHARPSELAARFAAKEAVAKALGVGMRMLSPIGIQWHDVEVLNARSGKPYLVLHGQAQRLAEEQHLTTWSISITHDAGIAMAFVVALEEKL